MRNNFLLIVLIMALIPLTSYSQDNKKKQFTVAGVCNRQKPVNRYRVPPFMLRMHREWEPQQIWMVNSVSK